MPSTTALPNLERILLVGFAQLRRYGNTRVSWFIKLQRGLIQNGHYVHFFSDRDAAAFEAPFGFRDLGKGRANRKLIETAAEIEPTLIIIGHADIITNQTLAAIRKEHSCPIVHCNNDPLFIPPNVDRIRRRLNVCDSAFISTGKKTIDLFFPDQIHRTHHMPNPVDPAIERFDSSKKSRQELARDLIFCGNATKFTQREEKLLWLKENLNPTVRFDTFGLLGTPPVWGKSYDKALYESAMGLNLNRDEGHHWYSSARMAQLAGNGLLVFTHAANGFHSLVPPDSLAYYETREDLKQQVERFAADDDSRRSHAARARNFFHMEMNNSLYARYIVEESLGHTHSHAYVWR